MKVFCASRVEMMYEVLMKWIWVLTKSGFLNMCSVFQGLTVGKPSTWCQTFSMSLGTYMFGIWMLEKTFMFLWKVDQHVHYWTAFTRSVSSSFLVHLNTDVQVCDHVNKQTRRMLICSFVIRQVTSISAWARISTMTRQLSKSVWIDKHSRQVDHALQSVTCLNTAYWCNCCISDNNIDGCHSSLKLMGHIPQCLWQQMT